MVHEGDLKQYGIREVHILKGYTLLKNWEAMARRVHDETFFDVITACIPVEQYLSKIGLTNVVMSARIKSY